MNTANLLDINKKTSPKIEANEAKNAKCPENRLVIVLRLLLILY